MAVKQKSPDIRFEDVPGELPEAAVPEDADLQSIAVAAIRKLDNLQESDMTPGALWRDFLALTGYFRTLHSATIIISAIGELKSVRHPTDFQPDLDTCCMVVKSGSISAWIDASFTFSTNGELPAKCAGVISVVLGSDGEWKIWMLRTWLEHFKGYGSPDILEPRNQLGTGSTNRLNGHNDGIYDAVIVGAGQAGLADAGRLKAVGASYVLLEQHEQIGDIWTNRYETLRYHTSKEYGVLPFDRTFLPEDDYMLTTKMIASGHRRFAERFGINVRLGTKVEKASWDDATHMWTVVTSSSAGDDRLTARNLVLAVGGYAGTPWAPQWPGSESFKGTALHSVDYQTSQLWKGKTGVVVGTANTGHDVAEDMVVAGLESVTMVQRGSTFVFPAKWLHFSIDVMYNANIPTEKADRLSLTPPTSIMRAMTNGAVFGLIDSHPERFDALERAGFKLERKGDIFHNLLIRGGGHYVDIGTSDRIAKGQIKMKNDSVVKEWTHDGLRFEDGSEIKADVVVLCTGFVQNFRESAAEMIGLDAANAMDDFFGIDAEGEIKGLAKPAGHPGLYYHGGDVRLARWLSRFIALQIQADVLGKPLQPYRKTFSANSS